MLDPKEIITWLSRKVKQMRRSRIKTLAALVSAAMRRLGSGVPALGRALPGLVSAKHCIKRVWRFLRNNQVELDAVHSALLRQLLPAKGFPLIVLMDWTEFPPMQTLTLSVAHDGRAVPFYSKTLPKKCGEGRMNDAESRALAFLSCVEARRTEVIVLADRGFGYKRLVEECERLGLCYLFRTIKGFLAYSERGAHCFLSELGLREGDGPKCWGKTTLGSVYPFTTRLITVWRRGSEGPWYLITNAGLSASATVGLYRRRMWIEAMFRDLKNPRLGLGADAVLLSEPARHDRHFLVIFLAYYFLMAFGAVAESRNLDRGLKADTTKKRVLSLATIGFHCIGSMRCSLSKAIKYLMPAPT
jgi:hypothetical protein